MHVIRDTANAQACAPRIATGTREERVERRLHFGSDERRSIFRAENDMEEDFREGLGRGMRRALGPYRVFDADPSPLG